MAYKGEAILYSSDGNGRYGKLADSILIYITNGNQNTVLSVNFKPNLQYSPRPEQCTMLPSKKKTGSSKTEAKWVGTTSPDGILALPALWNIPIVGDEDTGLGHMLLCAVCRQKIYLRSDV